MIEAPILITGHTRSGTNLVLRLIDGAPNLIAPPGEGKVNILRRFDNVNAFMNFKENVELNIDSRRTDQAFSCVPGRQTGKRFHGGIFTLVNSLFNSFSRMKYGLDFSDQRWVEKNHNLEFYFTRAMLLFGDIKMIYVLRDPLDNWLSWKKYAQKYYLPITCERFYFNTISHIRNEIKEHTIVLGQ